MDDTAQFEASLRSSVRRRQWLLPTLLILTAAGGGSHYLWSHDALPFLPVASAAPESSAEETAPSAGEPDHTLSPNPSEGLFPSPQPITAQDLQPALAPPSPAPASEPSPEDKKPSPRTAPARNGLVDFRLASATRVFLNGQDVGVTPFMPLEIPEGRHTVRFINAGLDKDVTRTISVKAGRTYVLKYNLGKN
nr:PEGA domain-containing protein [Stigmatella erecta]